MVSDKPVDAITEDVEDAPGELLTKDYFRAELHRALWIFSGVVLTGVAIIATIALAVAYAANS